MSRHGNKTGRRGKSRGGVGRKERGGKGQKGEGRGEEGIHDIF